MQLALHKFNDGENHFSQVRTLEVDGQIWFVANDVATTLGYSSPRDAIIRHCKSDGVVKRDVVTTNKNTPIQSMNTINEPNLYRLIVKSQLASAERFEKWVFEEVLPSIRNKGYYGKIDRSAMPNFAIRYKNNYHKIDPSYFSVITEMYVRLYSALEAVGYVIPDKGLHAKKMMPDISVGQGFAKYLKENDVKYYDNCKTYEHTFDDGREAQSAKMYSIDALPLFIKWLYNVWIPTKSQAYFKGRDDLALDYLPKLLSK